MITVVSFGEIMLRLSPPGYMRLGQSASLDMTFGGAEANVAVSLANYGVNARYITRLPKSALTEAFLRQMRGFGVDVGGVVRGGERMGVYFVEKGAAMRPSTVLYDRKYSAIAEARPGDIDWDAVMEGADWFHFTGITPALSQSAAALTAEGIAAARRAGARISCDLNYRKNLWTRDEAQAVMGDLVQNIDVLIANEEDAKDVFGLSAAGADIEGGVLSADGYRALGQKLAARLGVGKVAFTLRESRSANDNDWSGLIYDAARGTHHHSRKYAIHIVDRVGGGDAFGAGLIYGITHGMDDQHAVEFAAAASALKHTIEGDFNRVSVSEVNALLAGGGSGRVQR